MSGIYGVLFPRRAGGATGKVEKFRLRVDHFGV